MTESLELFSKGKTDFYKQNLSILLASRHTLKSSNIIRVLIKTWYQRSKWWRNCWSSCNQHSNSYHFPFMWLISQTVSDQKMQNLITRFWTFRLRITTDPVKVLNA